MILLREARAGFVDKGDVAVHLRPDHAQKGVSLDIKSKVVSMFGDSIRSSVLETIESYGLTGLHASVQDMGALDYVIRARVQTAIERAVREE